MGLGTLSDFELKSCYDQRDNSMGRPLENLQGGENVIMHSVLFLSHTMAEVNPYYNAGLGQPPKGEKT